MGKQTKKDNPRKENETRIGHVKLLILPTIIPRLSSNQLKILDMFATPMATRPNTLLLQDRNEVPSNFK